MRRALLLILLCIPTFFVFLGSAAITDSDEAFYAEASREMIESGDWITPRFNYELRFEKPILFYWMVAATYTVAGVSEGAAEQLLVRARKTLRAMMEEKESVA